MAEEQKQSKENNGGRPSVYGVEILAKAANYLYNYEKLGEIIPTVVGLALYLGVNKDTCYEWAKDEQKKEFSDIFKRVQESQELSLLNNGLQGKFNHTITKLMLSKHDWVEKSETDVTSKGERVINGINYIVPEDPNKAKEEKPKPKQNETNTGTNVEATPGMANSGGQGNK